MRSCSWQRNRNDSQASSLMRSCSWQCNRNDSQSSSLATGLWCRRNIKSLRNCNHNHPIARCRRCRNRHTIPISPSLLIPHRAILPKDRHLRRRRHRHRIHRRHGYWGRARRRKLTSTSPHSIRAITLRYRVRTRINEVSIDIARCLVDGVAVIC